MESVEDSEDKEEAPRSKGIELETTQWNEHAGKDRVASTCIEKDTHT